MQIVINGVNKGFLCAGLVGIYVEEVVLSGATIITWTEDVLCLESNNG